MQPCTHKGLKHSAESHAVTGTHTGEEGHCTEARTHVYARAHCRPTHPKPHTCAPPSVSQACAPRLRTEPQSLGLCDTLGQRLSCLLIFLRAPQSPGHAVFVGQTQPVRCLWGVQQTVKTSVYCRFLGGGPWGWRGTGPQAGCCPLPQNERENTSYDVATLQDEEGELPDVPGEPCPSPPCPDPILSPRSPTRPVLGVPGDRVDPQAWREYEAGRKVGPHL